MYAGSFSRLKKSFKTGTNSWHLSHIADAKNSSTMRFSRIPMISRSVLSSSWSQLFSTRTRLRNRSTMMKDVGPLEEMWYRQFKGVRDHVRHSGTPGEFKLQQLVISGFSQTFSKKTSEKQWSPPGVRAAATTLNENSVYLFCPNCVEALHHEWLVWTADCLKYVWIRKHEKRDNFGGELFESFTWQSLSASWLCGWSVDEL